MLKIDNIKIEGSASFSEINGKSIYRWQLKRWWDRRPKALICMLNSSYADGDKNDPTIVMLIKLIYALGYGGFTVVNWCPYIATNSDELFKWRWDIEMAHIIHWAEIRNLALIRELTDEAAVRIVAWGNQCPQAGITQKTLLALSNNLYYPLMCFGFNKDGRSPRHPMARGRNRLEIGRPLEVFRESLTSG